MILLFDICIFCRFFLMEKACKNCLKCCPTSFIGWVGMLFGRGSWGVVSESYCSLLCLTGLRKIRTACITSVACHTTGSLRLGHGPLLRPCCHPPFVITCPTVHFFYGCHGFMSVSVVIMKRSQLITPLSRSVREWCSSIFIIVNC